MRARWTAPCMHVSYNYSYNKSCNLKSESNLRLDLVTNHPMCRHGGKAIREDPSASWVPRGVVERSVLAKFSHTHRQAHCRGARAVVEATLC